MIKHYIAIAMLAVVLFITTQHIEYMREWVSDCLWIESEDEIDEMTDKQIIMGVAKHFDGGLPSFLLTC